MLSEWCRVNNLLVSTTKTKELAINFRKNETVLQPLIIGGACVKRVPVFRVLGIELEDGLTWRANTKKLLKQSLYFLRILRKNHMESMLRNGLCVVR